MQRLGLIDAMFTDLEDSHSALHIGSVCVFDGPPPTLREVRQHIDGRIAELPRYRQRMRPTPANLARPVWVDDPHFTIDHHVSRVRLAGDASMAELRAFTSHFLSHRLKTDRPLWETVFVDNLAGGQWALLWKVHHCVVDGVGGLGLLAAILDTDPDAAPDHRSAHGHYPAHRGQVAAEPTPWKLAVEGVRETVTAPLHGSARVLRQLANPIEAGRHIAHAAHGAALYAGAARPLPRNCLLGDLGSARTVHWTTVDLSDIAAIRHIYGGSINDVLLAAVTSGLRALLIERDGHAGHGAVRALVPVSVRIPATDGSDCADNHVSAFLVDLPVHEPRFDDALRTVTETTGHLKRSGEADGGALLVDVGSEIPAAVMDLGLRAVFSLPQRFINTVVTNVPGAQVPMYFRGRELRGMYPYVPIADRIRLGVAITSYNGVCYVTVTTDEASLPDAKIVTRSIKHAVTEALREISVVAASTNATAPD